jgi:prophage antirepressor-like protein
MNNELQVFNNTEIGALDVLMVGDKPHFPATECAKILGYVKPHDAIARHCRDSVKHGVIDSLGREQQKLFVREGDLYRLIVNSKLPTAQRFETWVFDEVLPSIRRHGAYIMPDKLSEMLNDPDAMIAVLTALKAERAKASALEETVGVQAQQIAEMSPKASYYDLVLNCRDAVAITTIAKDYGWSGRRMNDYLHDKYIQFKQGDIWLLYQKHAKSGYTCTKTHSYPAADGEIHSKVHTYWTQKGRLFLYDTLKSDGFLPVIERGGATE